MCAASALRGVRPAGCGDPRTFGVAHGVGPDRSIFDDPGSGWTARASWRGGVVHRTSRALRMGRALSDNLPDMPVRRRFKRHRGEQRRGERTRALPFEEEHLQLGDRDERALGGLPGGDDAHARGTEFWVDLSRCRAGGLGGCGTGCHHDRREDAPLTRWAPLRGAIAARSTFSPALGEDARDGGGQPRMPSSTGAK